MLDAKIRPWIDPPLDRLAITLVRSGISANQVTIAGFVIGLAAMFAIAFEFFLVGLILIALNRLSDGLDGAVARHVGATDFGGYLDIVLDFLFYSGVVFAFAVVDAKSNALAASFLIFSFVGTGSSFLTFAILAARRGVQTEARGRKSFYYLGGLTEGTETIALFLAMCAWPAGFPFLAWTFGILCWLTTASRIAMTWERFGPKS